jgi:hypothetical protein
MATPRSTLFGIAHHFIARARRYAPLEFTCAIALALSGATITSVRAQTISSFTVQDQTTPDFQTDFPRWTFWTHHLTETHTTSAAHVHFYSMLAIDVEKTTASTTASTSRLTTTMVVSDPLHCGWTLRFNDRRAGDFWFWADRGESHAEVHALSVGWSTGPSTGSLDLLEQESGVHGSKSDNYGFDFTRSSDATLSGSGSQSVTLTFAWDTYASGDPSSGLEAQRDAPPLYVTLGDNFSGMPKDPNEGFFLDIALQPCTSLGKLPSPITTTLPHYAFVAANGSCCFDAVMRDSSGVPMPNVPVAANFSGCDVTFCPKQDPAVTVDPVAKTATATTDASGVVHFCVCGSFSAPCTATLSADGVLLGSSSVVHCPQTPGTSDGYAVADVQYRIVFDTDVTPASATLISNYSLGSSGTVNSAVMDGSSAVILTVSGTGLSHGQAETVTVYGVVSSPDGLPMTTPRSVTFLAGALSVAEVRAPDPDSLAGSLCVDRSRFAEAGSAGGPRLSVHGIATARSSGCYCLQDEPGGLRSGIMVVSPPASLVAGHRYLIAGAVDTRLGKSEFANVAYLRDDGIGMLPMPMKQPLNVLLNTACDASQSLLTSDDFEGALVSADSVLVTADADSGEDFRVAGPYGVFSDTLVIANDYDGNGFAPTSGQLLRVTGILGFVSGRFELQPRSESDVTVLGSVAGVGPGPQGSGATLWVSVVPDPSRGGCAVAFVVPRPALTKLVIYDVAGRLVKTLVNIGMVAGPHTIRWEGTDDSGTRVPSGTYFARLSAGGETRSTRMVNLR